MKVRIKTWEEMEEKFGLSDPECIDCEDGFYDMMESDLPKDRVINVIEGLWKGWFISDDMIAEVIGDSE